MKISVEVTGTQEQQLTEADLYPALAEKAATLGFSLIQNHALVDGNKRVGHAALETFLVLNGQELQASVDDAEAVILRVADGRCSRSEFMAWVAGPLRTAG